MTKPIDQKKNSKLHIPVSSELKLKLEKQANEFGLSLSEYCRLALSTLRKLRIE